MPITIFENPRGKSIDVSRAKELCDETGDLLHEGLGVPDPQDKESRVSEGGKRRLRMALTRGQKEYPGFRPPSFFPKPKQIESAGRTVVEAVKKADLGVEEVVIEVWGGTTFVLREGETTGVTLPLPPDQLREIGSRLVNPKIKLVLSPQKQEGGSGSKELGETTESTEQKVALELGGRMAEALGYEKPISAEAEFALAADTDVAVEFDCDIKDRIIPKRVRQYLAKSALQVLNSNGLTKGGSGEVWIRQGRPTTRIFNVG